MEKLTQFDVCIVCALYEEAEAVLQEFSARCKVSFDKAFSGADLYEYRHTTIQNNRGEPLTVLVTWLADNGPVRTGLHLKPFLQEFHPRFAAMSGICAGYKEKDVRLGDLIVAEYAYHYEMGKDIIGKDGQKKHELQTITYSTTPQVLQYARSFQDWRGPVARLKRPKERQEQIKGSESLKESPPTCYIAPMASGMAVREDEPFPWLREYINRKTLALEMEAATFYLTLQEVSTLGIHSLVVKGVSDYADGSKNDEYHMYAERASAIYLLYFIREYVTSTTMPRRSLPPSSSRAGPSPVWNVPYRRNPHFTGREDLLDQLERHLSPSAQGYSVITHRAALTQTKAIKGLGGIGKTQVAIEYAYRAHERGRYTHTLWINAASEEAIMTSFVALANLLPSFPAKNETNQYKLLAAIKHWLEQCQQPWLLIFDNADDIALVHEYLPQWGNGSILLTTRANSVTSIEASFEVEAMGFIEGTQLLLRRAQRFEHASDEEINEAGNIVVALDHFPLALDQAGAYIDETQCGFSAYLEVYKDRRKALLARRGVQTTNYPDSVATTWSLSFQRVEQANPAAAELLRLCAYLSPDRIPEELIKDGAAHWSPLLRKAAIDLFTFNQMIEELLKFSLVKRLVKDQMLSIHRLVQVVQIEMMEPNEQRQWAERVVLAVNEIFPNALGDLAIWPKCLRYLEQAQACDTLIRQYQLTLIEAGHLLNRTGKYLHLYASYTLAEPLLEHALHIWEQQLGHEHVGVAYPLTRLANLYKDQKKYTEAESLHQRALRILEQHLGSEHMGVAYPLNGLANLYREQGKYTEAEPLYWRALRIWEEHLGLEHSQVAYPLSGLANLYIEQGKYAQAEPLLDRALVIREKQLGHEHPLVAISLNSLAELRQAQGRYKEAEPLSRRALTIREQQLGTEHPDTRSVRESYAALLEAMKQNEEGE